MTSFWTGVIVGAFAAVALVGIGAAAYVYAVMFGSNE